MKVLAGGWLGINRNAEREIYQYRGDSFKCLISFMEKVLQVRIIL